MKVNLLKGWRVEIGPSNPFRKREAPTLVYLLKVFNVFEVLRKCALFSFPGAKYLTTLHGDHDPFQNESLATKLPTR
jgi:hypothetical protein